MPSLLDRSKVQTIRPAWSDKPKDLRMSDNQFFKQQIESIFGIEKPARFVVGEKVKLMWKQRNSPADSFFCRKCGRLWDVEMEAENLPDWCGHQGGLFKKVLGTGIITEVFKIQMWWGNDAPLITDFKLKDTYKLAKLDGFKPGSNGKYSDFFNYFVNNYGLEDPKLFWVYRWKWI